MLFFTLAACLLTGTLFGLAPALQAARPDPQSALRETGTGATSGRTRQSLRRALFVSEVALAFVLAVGSGLLVRSLLKVQRVPLGFEPEGVLGFNVYLPDKGYETEPARYQFLQRSLEEIRSLPGVEAASAILCPPVAGRCWGSVYMVSDRPTPAPTDVPSSAFNVVEPGYFSTMRIPLLAGRFFTDADTADSTKVVIINESFAKKWWPNESPLGKRIKQGFPQDDRPFREIVGVVGDVAQEGLDLPIQTEVFLPFAQEASGAMTFVARTRSEPMSLARAATAAIHRVDPNQSVAEVQPLTRSLAESVARRKFTTLLLGLFGAAGARAGLRRHLRRRVLRRLSAHARDRDPHGPRRGSPRGPPPRLRPGPPPGGGRPPRRSGGSVRADAVHAKPALPDAAVRSTTFARSGRALDGRRPRGVRQSRAARPPREPDRGADDRE